VRILGLVDGTILGNLKDSTLSKALMRRPSYKFFRLSEKFGSFLCLGNSEYRIKLG
jgi:hypothetical protein